MIGLIAIVGSNLGRVYSGQHRDPAGRNTAVDTYLNEKRYQDQKQTVMDQQLAASRAKAKQEYQRRKSEAFKRKPAAFYKHQEDFDKAYDNLANKFVQIASKGGDPLDTGSPEGIEFQKEIDRIESNHQMSEQIKTHFQGLQKAYTSSPDKYTEESFVDAMAYIEEHGPSDFLEGKLDLPVLKEKKPSVSIMGAMNNLADHLRKGMKAGQSLSDQDLEDGVMNYFLDEASAPVVESMEDSLRRLEEAYPEYYKKLDLKARSRNKSLIHEWAVAMQQNMNPEMDTMTVHDVIAKDWKPETTSIEKADGTGSEVKEQKEKTLRGLVYRHFLLNPDQLINDAEQRGYGDISMDTDDLLKAAEDYYSEVYMKGAIRNVSIDRSPTKGAGDGDSEEVISAFEQWKQDVKSGKQEALDYLQDVKTVEGNVIERGAGAPVGPGPITLTQIADPIEKGIPGKKSVLNLEGMSDQELKNLFDKARSIKGRSLYSSKKAPSSGGPFIPKLK